MRQSVNAGRDVAYMTSAVVGSQVADARQLLRDRYVSAVTSLRRPRIARPRRHWIVVVSLPIGRDIRLQRCETLLDDGAVA